MDNRVNIGNLVPGRVSVIIPCYNVERYIERQLDSVLAQDYEDIECIVIDDGSSDGTAEILKSYATRFGERGFIYRCIHQENGGQASAVYKGLMMVSGEFLVWPDADDYYSESYVISKMVDVFRNCDDSVGMVRTQNIVVQEADLQPVSYRGIDRSGIEPKDSLFEDCLFAANGFYFSPGAYMIRTADFFKTSRTPISMPHYGGQNWQMFLPILYNFNCYTIPQVLYTTVAHGDSHSRVNHNYEGEIRKIEAYEQTLCETLHNIIAMGDSERQKYLVAIKSKYIMARFRLAYAAGKSEDSCRYYKMYRQLVRKVGLRMKMNYLVAKCNAFGIVRKFRP